MGRERWGRRLVALGLIAMIAALAAIGITRPLADTHSVQQASAELLDVDTWHEAVGTKLGAALDTAYPDLNLSPDERAFAVERMLVNGDLIDEVERAVEPAHQAWLAGGPFELALDSRATTQAAIAGLRDANPGLVDRIPSETLVEVERITIPMTISASSVERYRMVATAVLIAGLVTVVLGSLAAPRRFTLKLIARAAVVFGVLVAAAVLLLPWPEFNRLDPNLAVVGALLEPLRTPALVVAALALFIGLWLHASADQLGDGAGQTGQGERRRRRDSTPARSGGPPPAGTRKAERHRTEAIDAFFEPSEAVPSERVTVIDLDDLESDDEMPGDSSIDDDVEASPALIDDDTGDESAAVELTPEQERAEALAAERREALERIDGSRSRYRTHLPR